MCWDDLSLVLHADAFIKLSCIYMYPHAGMLELVTEASTLREIQTEHGVTGSFKDKPLSEWLMRHNPTESSYQQVSKAKYTYSSSSAYPTFVIKAYWLQVNRSSNFQVHVENFCSIM